MKKYARLVILFALDTNLSVSGIIGYALKKPIIRLLDELIPDEMSTRQQGTPGKDAETGAGQTGQETPGKAGK